LSDILNHPELPWVRGVITYNRNIPLRDALKHPEIPWIYSIFVENMITDNGSAGYDYKKYLDISSHPITTSVVESNPDVPWDWYQLLLSSDFPSDFIIKNKHKMTQAVIPDIFSHHNVQVKYCIDNHINPITVSIKRNLTIQDILDNSDFNWDWNFVSMNPNITVDDIEQNPQLPWVWGHVSVNPNLTIEFIDRHIDKLSFENLCYNQYIYDTWAGFKSMRNDVQFKHDFIVNTPGLGMLKDIAEIVADYCGFQ
jgi:hypothetical protein